jgi:hypothetical protein
MRRPVGIAVLVVTLWSMANLGPAASAADPLTLSGRLAGKEFPAGASSPSRLGTRERALLELTIRNDGLADVVVGTVILRGRAISLAFFNYETSVAIAVPAGTTVSRQFLLDLASLKGQANGLFNAEITLLDQNRHQLASRKTAVDVRGSWRSVYNVFGVALLVATVAAFARATTDLARHRLSSNRWRRAVRFMVPGIGTGLVIVFTLSATRVLLTGPMTWMPIVAVTAAIGFALGYFTPTPDDGAPAGEPVPEAPEYLPARP